MLAFFFLILVNASRITPSDEFCRDVDGERVVIQIWKLNPVQFNVVKCRKFVITTHCSFKWFRPNEITHSQKRSKYGPSLHECQRKLHETGYSRYQSEFDFKTLTLDPEYPIPKCNFFGKDGETRRNHVELTVVPVSINPYTEILQDANLNITDGVGAEYWKGLDGSMYLNIPHRLHLKQKTCPVRDHVICGSTKLNGNGTLAIDSIYFTMNLDRNTSLNKMTNSSCNDNQIFMSPNNILFSVEPSE